jgi:hypothetical protein
LPAEHGQLMAQHQQLDVLGELAAPAAPDQQPQHSREGEIGERKEHAPMLSPPAANGSKHERLGRGQRPIGCEARHDLVFARARETTMIEGATAGRYSPNPILEPLRVLNRSLATVQCPTMPSPRELEGSQVAHRILGRVLGSSGRTGPPASMERCAAFASSANERFCYVHAREEDPDEHRRGWVSYDLRLLRSLLLGDHSQRQRPPVAPVSSTRGRRTWMPSDGLSVTSRGIGCRPVHASYSSWRCSHVPIGPFSARPFGAGSRIA